MQQLAQVFAVCIAITAVAPVFANGETAPKTIEARQARQFLNQKVTVTFKVRHAKAACDPARVYLDSEEDYRHPDNLGVLIEAAALPAFEKAGIPRPAEHFDGKTIQVTGTPVLRDDLVFIVTTDPGGLRIAMPPSQTR